MFHLLSVTGPEGFTDISLDSLSSKIVNLLSYLVSHDVESPLEPVVPMCIVTGGGLPDDFVILSKLVVMSRIFIQGRQHDILLSLRFFLNSLSTPLKTELSLMIVCVLGLVEEPLTKDKSRKVTAVVPS